MSAYPVHGRKGYFADTLEILAPGVRDVYGAVTPSAADPVVVHASVRRRSVQAFRSTTTVEFSGASIWQDGIVAVLPPDVTVDIIVGTICRYDGEQFTVMSVSRPRDPRGNVARIEIKSVSRAGEVAT